MTHPPIGRKLRRLILAGLACAGFSGVAAAEESVVGRMAEYTTSYEETLIELAPRFGLGFIELKAANPGVNEWVPGEGTRLVLPTAHLLPDAPHDGIVINLADMRLYHFRDDGVRSYPVGVGREGRHTPLGTTTVVRKAEDPTWYPPESIRAEKPWLPAAVPPGPENPLGKRALYLGWPAYLVHGTNMPYGVGRRVSSGCIRMYPDDILELYDNVRPGTRVTVVDQPVKVGWIGDDLYIEVHPTLDQALELEAEGRFTPAFPDDLVQRVADAADGHEVTIDWAAVERAGRERLGYPIKVASKSAPGPLAAPGPLVLEF